MEMSAKSTISPSAVEPALKFGPPWLRALSHGNSTAGSPPVSPDAPAPKYKLAQYRYGREEMLALFSKDINIPECLNEFDYLIAEKCQTPLALVLVTEEEQRILSRSVNSDVAVRGSNKGPSGPGNSMSRGGRGGSVDRGRGRGRGGYHPRGFSFEDGEDGSLSGYSRLRPIERSQSASEKDQRWEERDRRFERPFAGRTGGILDDTSSIVKPDGPPRAPSENWRRSEKEDEGNSWRNTNNSRGVDRFGNRGSWRNHNDRDRSKNEVDGIKDTAQHKDTILNGPGKNISNHPRQRSSSGHFWDDEVAVDNLPEWSVEEDTTTDVGTFDSSGAFLETKVSQNNNSKEDIFVSDEEELEECKPKEEEKPQPKSVPKHKEKTMKITTKKSTTKPPTVHSKSPPFVTQKQTVETAVFKTSCETKPVNKPPCDVLHEGVRVPQTHTLAGKQFVASPPISSVPTISSLLNVQKNTANVIPPTSLNDVPSFIEEDTFAHHKTATENMMAQWTQEDEQRVVSESVDKSIILPIHHNDAYKWFYRDPQGEIQGPFLSSVMCDWLNGGFFAKDLKIKRGCDERFMQLGELMQLRNCIPFLPGNEPPPLRAVPIVTELSTPFTQSSSLPNHTTLPVQYPQPDTSALQQQLLQQLIYRQVQAQQAANQLKQLDSFVSLPLQQQALVLQELHTQLLPEQQIPRSGTNAVGETSVLNQTSSPPFPLLGLNVPTMLKNNISLWSTLSQNPGNWASNRPATKAPSAGGIWDMDTTIPAPIEVSELEKRMAAEEEEKRRVALETLKRLDEEKRKEEKRKEEELKRKQEEERILREIQKQQEEEKKRLEELQRLKEEEQRQLEEMRKEEQRRREELRLQEERRKEEHRLLEEQRIRVELEEQAREELIQKEETLRIQQEEKKRQEELQRKLLWEQEQERVKELEKQKETQRLKEQEEMKLRREMAEKERELQMKRESENMSRLIEQKGPAWGLQTVEKPAELSLTDIQRLQEQKEKEEREKLKFQQQMLQQQQALKQVQINKNGLSWAKRTNENITSVKSLAEIQIEEAQQMAHQQKVQKTAATTVQATAASGVWGNSSQINRVSAAPTWSTNTNCFWDDALKSSTAQNPVKTKECAFPALSNCIKPSTINSNKNKNLRAKKDEDAVLRLFDTHRKSNDEFTSWCTDALSHLPSSVDVPTFVAFLKDVDSPYEVYDYVRSYLGEGKEAKEFGKQFLERRSRYRNQTKQSPAEVMFSVSENMWGPAPAITPAVNKAAAQTANDCDATICTKGKTKKKKNRMQKVDNSMLGFTVQPNPDRINIGEIDRVEGM